MASINVRCGFIVLSILLVGGSRAVLRASNTIESAIRNDSEMKFLASVSNEEFEPQRSA